MSAKMKTAAVLCTVLTAIFALLYCIFTEGIWLSLSITAGTMAYHFLIRLAVGAFVNAVYKNPNCQNIWFRQKRFEPALYKFLNIMRWKRFLPTYNTELFDPSLHTWDEIIQNMCRAELIHEMNFLLSFLPIAAVIWFGSLTAFLITSVLAAIFDLTFVMMQRFNRPRVVKLSQRHAALKSSH